LYGRWQHEVLRERSHCLRMEKQANFDIFTDYVFPNLKDFRFSTHSFSLSDSDLPTIIKSLPNLKTFSPHGKRNRTKNTLFTKHYKMLDCSIATPFECARTASECFFFVLLLSSSCMRYTKIDSDVIRGGVRVCAHFIYIR